VALVENVREMRDEDGVKSAGVPLARQKRLTLFEEDATEESNAEPFLLTRAQSVELALVTIVIVVCQMDVWLLL